MYGAQKWLAEKEWLAVHLYFDYLREFEAKKEKFSDFHVKVLCRNLWLKKFINNLSGLSLYQIRIHVDM